MKNFEKEIEKIKIPRLENDPFESKLRASLVEKYFDKSHIYAVRFRYAVAFASLLLIFTFVSILNPTIAYKINRFAFQSEQPEESENINAAENNHNQQQEDFLRYTSIHNPSLSNKLDPADFEEDKAYLIRKYTSSTEGSVMVVSEFKQDKKKSSRRISY